MADYYVRETSYGANNGTDWDNAWDWTTFAASATLVVDDIVHLAGAIDPPSGHTFNSPDNGSDDDNRIYYVGDKAGDPASFTIDGSKYLAANNWQWCTITDVALVMTGLDNCMRVSNSRSGTSLVDCDLSSTDTGWVLVNMAASTARDMTDYRWDGCTFTGGQVGIDWLGSGASASTIERWTIDNCIFTGQSENPIHIRSASTTTCTVDTLKIRDNYLSDAGYMGMRLDMSHASMAHLTYQSKDLLLTGNIVRNCGTVDDGGLGGGITVVNFTCSDAALNDAKQGFYYNWCYDNGGSHGGFNALNIQYWNVFLNQCNGHYSTDADGNGMLPDTDIDNVYLFHNECHDNVGDASDPAAQNDGYGIMILKGTNVYAHHNICSGNKRGYHDVSNLAADADSKFISNNAFLDCEKTGVMISSGTANGNNLIFKNNILTAAGAGAQAWFGDVSSPEDALEDYNIYYGFDTPGADASSFTNQTPGSNNIYTDPGWRTENPFTPDMVQQIANVAGETVTGCTDQPDMYGQTAASAVIGPVVYKAYANK